MSSTTQYNNAVAVLEQNFPQESTPIFQAHRAIDAQIDKLLGLKAALIRAQLAGVNPGPDSTRRALDVAIDAVELACSLKAIAIDGAA